MAKFRAGLKRSVFSKVHRNSGTGRIARERAPGCRRQSLDPDHSASLGTWHGPAVGRLLRKDRVPPGRP
jgi:hypothetical protein